MSSPRAELEQIGDRPGADERQRAAVGAERDREGVGGGGRGDPADAAEQEQRQHDQRAVAALQQPAEQRDRAERDERVAGVVVGERRR